MADQTRKNPLPQKVCTLIAYYLAIASIYPPMKVVPGYTLSCFAAMLAWIVFAGISKPAFFTIFAKKLMAYKQLMLFFVMYTVLVPYLFDNSVISHRYMVYGQLLIFYLIYQYNREYGYDNSSKAIIKWSIPFIVVTSALTLRGLIEKPSLSRSLKGGGDYTTTLWAQGIGGYDFIYFLVFLLIMLLYFIFNKRFIGLKFRYRMAIYALVMLFGSTMVFSNYFTALIMVLVSSGILLVTRQSSFIAKFFIAFTGVIALLFNKVIALSVLGWLANNLSNGMTLERVLTLQADLLGYGEESLMEGRTPTFQMSWDAFLQHPVFGIVIRPIEYSDGYLIGFGQHSHFLDTFALFGALIGVFNVLIVVYPFLKRLKHSLVVSGLNLAMLASVLIIFSVNIVTPSIGYAIFFMYPVLYDWQVDRLNRMRQDNLSALPTTSHAVTR